MSRHLMVSWRKVREDTCPRCGMPNVVHEVFPDPSEYRASTGICPAMKAIEKAKPDIRKAFDADVKAGLDPSEYVATWAKPAAKQ